MDMDSANISKRSDSSSGGSQDKTNSSINPDSDVYIIDTIITNNTQSKRLATINEAISCLSSMTDYYKKINNVKTLNERSQQKTIHLVYHHHRNRLQVPLITCMMFGSVERLAINVTIMN